ncbi:MAG: flagellar export chaperone FliS [Dehalococcoidia bacterium]|nr:flagellar export chaperone FliS [Dehalococcoidia bacterium]
MLQVAGYSAYRRVQAETSSSGELVLLLYDGLLQRLQGAVEALEARDYAQANGLLVRSQEIVLELISSLDMDSGEIARQLAPLYEYHYQRLLTANLQKDAGAVREVIRLVTPVRDAWAHAVRSVAGSVAGGAAMGGGYSA